MEFRKRFPRWLGSRAERREVKPFRLTMIAFNGAGAAICGVLLITTDSFNYWGLIGLVTGSLGVASGLYSLYLDHPRP